MAQVLFAGGKYNSFEITGTIAEVTTVNTFNSTYCDSALRLSVGTGDTAKAVLVDTAGTPTSVTTGQTIYTHVDMRTDSGNLNATGYFFALRDSSGFPWLSLRNTSSSQLGIYYNSGTGASPVWTQLGTNIAFSALIQREFDIKLTLGSPHVVEFSNNGSLHYSGTFTQASFTSVSNVTLHCPYAGGSIFYSQLLVTEGISTINAKVKYTTATAAGTNSGWTGAYTDINEAIGSDATTVSTPTVGVKSTFAWGDVTVPVGYIIKDVFIYSRGKNDGASPANIKTVIRSGATDYSSANMPGIGTSFAPLVARYATNPNTSVAWTEAGWNAVEVGVESAT